MEAASQMAHAKLHRPSMSIRWGRVKHHSLQRSQPRRAGSSQASGGQPFRLLRIAKLEVMRDTPGSRDRTSRWKTA